MPHNGWGRTGSFVSRPCDHKQRETEHSIPLDGTGHAEKNLNVDQLSGRWTTLKGQIQAKWGKLTSDDLAVIEGDRKRIAGRLPQRYGYTKAQGEEQWDEWTKSL